MMMMMMMMMMTKCQFYWWRKPEYPEETTNTGNTTDKLSQSERDIGESRIHTYVDALIIVRHPTSTTSPCGRQQEETQGDNRQKHR